MSQTPIQYEYDDLFIYAPSFLLAESGTLTESKAVGSVHPLDLRLVQDIAMGKGGNRAAFAKERKRGVTGGKRKLIQIQDRARASVTRTVRKFYRRTINHESLREDVTREMKRAWRETYMAGLRAGGTVGTVKEPGLPMIPKHDERWLRSAIREERKYLDRFLDAIITDNLRMPWNKRLDMYIETLNSFYDSARVIAMPDDVVIHWVGPVDKRKCESCTYLIEHSPYTKNNLPCTPKSGMTLCLCLTNCNAKIKTERGNVSWTDIRVGDRVWTHKNRWRKVTAKYLNRSKEQHRYVAVVTPTGLMGLTHDHVVYTSEGPVTAETAAVRGLRILQCEDYTPQSVGVVSHVCDTLSMEGGARTRKTSSGRCRTCQSQDDVRATDRRFVLHDQTRRAKVRSILGRQSTSLHLSISMAMDQSQRADTARMRSASQGSQLHERFAEQFGSQRVSQTRAGSRRGNATKVGDMERLPDVWVEVQDDLSESSRLTRNVLQSSMRGSRTKASSSPNVFALSKELHGTTVRSVQGTKTRIRDRVLLADLLQISESDTVADPIVCLVREAIQEGYFRDGAETVEVGQVLLLPRVFPTGSPLYDIGVETDHSFVVEGQVIHNSNCRDKLLLRRASHAVVERLERDARFTRVEHLKTLKRIKRKRHRHPPSTRRNTR